MPNVSAIVDKAEKEGIEHIADLYDMSMSKVIGIAVRKLIEDFEDDVPDWVNREVSHEQMKAEGNPFLRMMHFKQRQADYIRNCLVDDNGNIKEYPPHPDKVEKYYVEDQIMPEIEKNYPEHEDEFKDHMRERMDWYRLMHPDTGANDPRTEAVNLIMLHLRYGNDDKARRAASEASMTVSETADQLMNKAEETMNSDDWRHEWDRAIGGGLAR